MSTIKGEIKLEERIRYYGLCSHHDNCELYTPYSHGCNQNRRLFYINGRKNPFCYRPKTESK